MTSRERVQRTLQFKNPDRVPRDVWALPGVTEGRADEFQAHLKRFPTDFGGVRWKPGQTGREKGTAYKKGSYTDFWGATFAAGEDGVYGEIKDPLLADWKDLAAYSLPWEYLKQADLSEVDASCRESDRFIAVWTEARPFERLQFLRGTENLFVDLAVGSPELTILLRRIHEWELTAVEMWSKTAVDAICISDDWGTQTSLLISPAMWREIFKPLYQAYCDIARSAGKFVFFHSDGHIAAIYDDLIEIGVHAINSQLFCMDIEELGRKYRGKITLWGELDRQHIQPFGTPDEVRAAVRRIRKAFDTGHGGLIAQCEWGKLDPYANIAALYDEWDRPATHGAGS